MGGSAGCWVGLLHDRKVVVKVRGEYSGAVRS
jgi:hypothetical protein